MPGETSQPSQISGKFGDTRVIALDVRRHRFGFVVLQGTSVLDCGNRSCNRADAVQCLRPRLQRILATYAPVLILMHSRVPNASADVNERDVLAYALQDVGRASGAEILEIPEPAVRAYFALHNAHTKHEIAYAVASFLPELSWKLPPRRKAWESEHYRMSIFNAAALALTHIGPRPPSRLA